MVASGDGSIFPTIPFNCTAWPSGTQPTLANAEIIRVTVKATDTFTITRSQEGTSAKSIAVGWQIAATVTAKLLSDIETASSGAVNFTIQSSMNRFTITDANVSTSSKITMGIRRANITDAADPGWSYVANIVTLATGSFDVLILALDWDGGPSYAVPNENVTLFYHIWN